MEKLMKTSKTVDTILKVVYKILQVGGIIIFVGVGICLIAGALGQLPPAELTSVSFGDVELIFAEPQIVDNSFMTIEMGTTLVMALLAIAVTCYLIKVLRKVLVPMIAGQPFDGTVSTNIKKLGITIIVSGIIIDLIEVIGSNLAFYMYDISELFLSENIGKVMINGEIGLGNVLVGVLVIMLSYVFRYGEQLQQQADETL
ncbi:MAG: DUF2975 domain-containing protein [Lachnospiraceae bacterium]|nr:DUF2975 domain-containing protein [Lachnospiraceae bacterium]